MKRLWDTVVDILWRGRADILLVLLLIMFVLIIMITQLGAQNVINGTFQSSWGNNACQINQSNASINAHVYNVNATGKASELDWYYTWNGCQFFEPCGNPILAFDVMDSGKVDAVAVELDYPLIKGNQYTLFFEYAGDKTTPIGELEVGVSAAANSQGSVFVTTPQPSRFWTTFVKTFSSPATGKYLTFTIKGNRYLGLANVQMLQYLTVELTDFKARSTFDHVHVTWKTSSETNNDYFILLRAGEEFVFRPIARANGFGNSSTDKDYLMIDEYPLLGVNYYKLKQVDYDEKFAESQPISCKYSGIDVLNFFDGVNINLIGQQLK